MTSLARCAPLTMSSMQLRTSSRSEFAMKSMLNSHPAAISYQRLPELVSNRGRHRIHGDLPHLAFAVLS